MAFNVCAISLRISFDDSPAAETTSLAAVFSCAVDTKFEILLTFSESSFNVPCIYPSSLKFVFQMMKLFPQFQPLADLYPPMSSLYSFVASFQVLGE